jgi:membrane-bound lytic murein transglycosylase D
MYRRLTSRVSARAALSGIAALASLAIPVGRGAEAADAGAAHVSSPPGAPSPSSAPSSSVATQPAAPTVVPPLPAASASSSPLTPSARGTPPPAKAPAAKPPATASAGATKGGKSSVTTPVKTVAKTRAADVSTRRQVAGGPTQDDAAAGAESVEMRTLREAERELFPPALPVQGQPWPTELASPLSAPSDRPLVHASGLPPSPVPSAPPSAEGGRDLSWMAKLQMPDLPVRWDARVVRYLEFFKDDPRGRSVLATWLRRSGRYRDAMRRTLRRKGIPEDMLWLAMIESGFEPTARSKVGAMGLWQFMPDTAKAYGLPVDRWADQRLNPQAATEAAADFLSDLHRRFGSWELAIAAYNMGYWGVAGAVRKYNTNDFWVLSRLEAGIPWETTLYVPKIIAAAIVGRNPAVFGLHEVPLDASMDSEEVNVPPGTALSVVAQAAGCTTKEVEQLNPELRASRTPPAMGTAATGTTGALDYPVKVPAGRAAAATQKLARLHDSAPPLERITVRFGESLEQIAASRHVPLAKLVELNAIAPGEVVRGGTVLLVPHVTTTGPASPSSPGARPREAEVTAIASTSPLDPGAKPVVAVVPADIFVYPDRRRVFYRVLVGDTIREIADTFRVSIDEVRRWNDLDPAARLQEGMTIQLFVPEGADLASTVVLGENDVRVLPVGSEEFFGYWEALKGRKRVTLTAKDGDTLAALGTRYGMTPGMMERINHRSRGEALKAGDAVVVYVALARGGKGDAVVDPATADTRAPVPNGELPDAPFPDGLPPLN